MAINKFIKITKNEKSFVSADTHPPYHGRRKTKNAVLSEIPNDAYTVTDSVVSIHVIHRFQSEGRISESPTFDGLSLIYHVCPLIRILPSVYDSQMGPRVFNGPHNLFPVLRRQNFTSRDRIQTVTRLCWQTVQRDHQQGVEPNKSRVAYNPKPCIHHAQGANNVYGFVT